MADWLTEFLAESCPECYEGTSEPCPGGDVCNSLESDFFFSPECRECLNELTVPLGECLDCQPAKTPADCQQCLSQISDGCTTECFVALDNCNLCLKQQQPALDNAVWPLLALPTNADPTFPFSTAPPAPPTLPSTSSHFLCQWYGCQATFPSHEHLKRHVLECHLHHFGHLQPHHGHTSDILKKHHHHLPPDIASTPSSSDSVSGDANDALCRWDGCGMTFGSSSELMEHMNRVHVLTGQSEYRCGWEGCKRGDKPFLQRQKLLRHLQTHAGDRPMVCEVCNKTFTDQSSLNQHATVHSGTRPHVCPHPNCGKSFTLPSALTIHMRTHSKEKPFKCPFDGCDAAFAESSNLRKHVKTHTGEKNFCCNEPGCGKRFARSDQLSRHRKIHAKTRG